MVVKDGEIVGEGATEPRPGMHAEPVAINAAGDKANGATLYCSLEPHAFQGVAPPCTEAIINAGISRVVSPIEDPNPDVSGNGFRQLRAAGVEVDRHATDQQLHRANSLIEGFAHHLKTRRPLVTLKIATTLDGKIATRTGESQWITNETSRAQVHHQRHRTDALITGIGTVLADQPRLTARDPDGNSTGRPKLRVAIDTHGRMPKNAPLLDEDGEVLWIVGDGTEVETAGESLSVHKASLLDGKVDLEEVVDLLGSRGLHNAMIEAGSGLAGAFVDAGLVDKVSAYIAPKIFGGKDSPGPVGGVGISGIADALSLKNITHKTLDGDILIEGYVSKVD